MRCAFDADGERRVSSAFALWFRNGGRTGRADFMRQRYQSKIYIESNQSDFQPIFGEFTSMQTLTIYRRLLVRSKRRHQPQFNQKKSPGSRDVFPASHGILARACARAVAQGT